MAPIRVALIGLGPVSTEGYRTGEWGVQHMNAIKSSPHYELVAVCNSSVESARRSIESHGLPSTVKAYGSPDDVARDPDVDLVAVVTNINSHYRLVKPALQQKKKVLVEFPVTPDPAKTEELLALANEGGLATVVGAQGRVDPAFRKLKELVESKAIGDIVYSSFTGVSAIVTSDGWAQANVGFLDIEAGISRVNIVLGHTLDVFHHVLGNFESAQTVLKTQAKETKLFDNQGNVVDPAYRITAPDTVLVQGVLTSGAAATFNMRFVRVPGDGVGTRWIISGTEGEIVYTCDPAFFQMVRTGEKLLLRKWADEKAEEVSVAPQDEGADYLKGLHSLGANTLRLYDAFAKGDKNGFSDFEQTLQTEKLLAKIKKEAVWAP